MQPLHVYSEKPLEKYLLTNNQQKSMTTGEYLEELQGHV
jgi:hypothetical protein